MNTLEDGRLVPISYEELKKRLENIRVREHQVFLMLTYACMARVGEIVKGRYRKNPPISSDRVRATTSPGGYPLIKITVLTEKTNTPRTNTISRELEAWLSEPILQWAQHKQGPLFPYSTRWGGKVFQKYFPEYNQHIHLLRGWRYTHYRQGKVTGYFIRGEHIFRLGGWGTSATPEKYYDGTVTEEFEDFLCGHPTKE